jgi:isocitrate dehydrogenase
MYEKITPPETGSRITFNNGEPIVPVPSKTITPYFRGDGTGVDIWSAAQRVFDAAVEKAYGGDRKIVWFKVYAGDEACEVYGTYQYLPEDTLTAIREYGVAIKGPLTTLIGGGIRSLNVALRQIHDLYACVRSCKYYAGTPSPHKSPEKLDVIVYRENTEDIYLGIEWKQGSEIGERIPLDSGISIKPISKTGLQSLVRRAIQHALRLPKCKQMVTLVHKGNIMKYTEGAFRDWGYELATSEFRQYCVTEQKSWILSNKERNPDITLEETTRQIEPDFDALTAEKQAKVTEAVKAVLDRIWEIHGNGQWKEKVMVNDRISDSIFQQIQAHSDEYSILAFMNLNGDLLGTMMGDYNVQSLIGYCKLRMGRSPPPQHKPTFLRLLEQGSTIAILLTRRQIASTESVFLKYL